jgi:hypothetical protein
MLNQVKLPLPEIKLRLCINIDKFVIDRHNHNPLYLILSLPWLNTMLDKISFHFSVLLTSNSLAI